MKGGLKLSTIIISIILLNHQPLMGLEKTLKHHIWNPGDPFEEVSGFVQGMIGAVIFEADPGEYPPAFEGGYPWLSAATAFRTGTGDNPGRDNPDLR